MCPLLLKRSSSLKNVQKKSFELSNHNEPFAWILIRGTITINVQIWVGKHFWFKCTMRKSLLQTIEECLNCWNWTFQTKVMANWTWTNHNEPFAWILIHGTITINVQIWVEKHFWVKCTMRKSLLQAIEKCLNCWNWTIQTQVMVD